MFDNHILWYFNSKRLKYFAFWYWIRSQNIRNLIFMSPKYPETGHFKSGSSPPLSKYQYLGIFGNWKMVIFAERARVRDLRLDFEFRSCLISSNTYGFKLFVFYPLRLKCSIYSSDQMPPVFFALSSRKNLPRLMARISQLIFQFRPLVLIDLKKKKSVLLVSKS